MAPPRYDSFPTLARVVWLRWRNLRNADEYSEMWDICDHDDRDHDSCSSTTQPEVEGEDKTCSPSPPRSPSSPASSMKKRAPQRRQEHKQQQQQNAWRTVPGLILADDTAYLGNKPSNSMSRKEETVSKAVNQRQQPRRNSSSYSPNPSAMSTSSLQNDEVNTVGKALIFSIAKHSLSQNGRTSPSEGRLCLNKTFVLPPSSADLRNHRVNRKPKDGEEIPDDWFFRTPSFDATADTSATADESDHEDSHLPLSNTGRKLRWADEPAEQQSAVPVPLITVHNLEYIPPLTLRVVVLLLHPLERLFEFLQCEFDVDEPLAVSHVLQQLHGMATLPLLAKTKYTSLCRRRPPEYEEELLNPLSLQDYYCSGDVEQDEVRWRSSVEGDVLVAVPDGVPPKACLAAAGELLSDKTLCRAVQKAKISGRALRILQPSAIWTNPEYKTVKIDAEEESTTDSLSESGSVEQVEDKDDDNSVELLASKVLQQSLSNTKESDPSFWGNPVPCIDLDDFAFPPVIPRTDEDRFAALEAQLPAVFCEAWHLDDSTTSKVEANVGTSVVLYDAPLSFPGFTTASNSSADCKDECNRSDMQICDTELERGLPDGDNSISILVAI